LPEDHTREHINIIIYYYFKKPSVFKILTLTQPLKNLLFSQKRSKKCQPPNTNNKTRCAFSNNIGTHPDNISTGKSLELCGFSCEKKSSGTLHLKNLKKTFFTPRQQGFNSSDLAGLHPNSSSTRACEVPLQSRGQKNFAKARCSTKFFA